MDDLSKALREVTMFPFKSAVCTFTFFCWQQLTIYYLLYSNQLGRSVFLREKSVRIALFGLDTTAICFVRT